MSLRNFFQRLYNNRLVKDSFWSLAGNVIGKGLSLLAGVLIARYLGRDVFGEYGVIKVTILTIGTFSTFGLGYAATKYVAEFKEKDVEKIPIFLRHAYLITLSFSGVMALLLFGFADVVASDWLDASHLSTPLKILSALIVFNALTTTQIGVLSGFGCFQEIAKINILIGFLTFVLSVLLTYVYLLDGALLALLIVQMVNCLLNLRVVRREMAKIPKVADKDNSMLKEIFVFSTPIALQEAIYSVTNWVSIFLLIKYSTFGEMGLYSAAMQWNAIVLFVPGILRNVVLSHLAKNNGDLVAHDSVLKQVVLINIVSTLTPCLVVFATSSFIAKLYGASFEGVAPLIILAVFITVFQSVSNVYVQAYMSIGRNWLMLALRIARELMLLLFFLLLVSLINKAGAEAMLMSMLAANMLFLVLVWYGYKAHRG